MTSIGLGEDGPTHQPVEHLAALRAIPNLHVFRPADAVETAECWELALESRAQRPSVLALTRQNLPALRVAALGREPARPRGAYVLRRPPTTAEVTLIATGSEVEIAVAAKAKLRGRTAHRPRVVSMPCLELFRPAGRGLPRARCSAPRRSRRGRGRRPPGLGRASSATTATSSA